MLTATGYVPARGLSLSFPNSASTLASQLMVNRAYRTKSFDAHSQEHKVTAHELDAKAFLVSLTHSLTSATKITIHIPGPLRDCCAGAAVLALSATSVRAVLDELERRYPALHRSICDETGTVRRHINLFVNTHHMRDRNGLDTPLDPGDEVTILPAVSGG
ncbi:MAG: hypothetical protein DME21_01495 [Verrucomicrobia bacterium]|nr:MAG: hypothetical protein DME21_01495 [Verrucomicrobiota bacterium]